MKIIIILTLCLLSIIASYAKGFETEFDLDESIQNFSPYSPYQFNYRQIAAPVALVAIGSLSLYTSKNNWFDDESSEWISSGHGRLTFDDYMQYSPTFIMWGMDLAGCHSRHRFRHQTSILAISAVSLFSIIQISKNSIGRLRPDDSTYNSFPSGHTATAFMCAEILRQEYGHYSPIIGVIGYTLAAATAYMRVYNRRHWATDTIAGAGVGILSARIGYWIAPKLNRALWGNVNGHENDFKASLTPYSDMNNIGMNISLTF